MQTWYFTFGQIHLHRVNNKTFDKDCVVEIHAESKEAARKEMFRVFGQKWANQYEQKPDMEYYPRGVITL